jgi:hypothetical protein
MPGRAASAVSTHPSSLSSHRPPPTTRRLHAHPASLLARSGDFAASPICHSCVQSFPPSRSLAHPLSQLHLCIPSVSLLIPYRPYTPLESSSRRHTLTFVHASRYPRQDAISEVHDERALCLPSAFLLNVLSRCHPIASTALRVTQLSSGLAPLSRAPRRPRTLADVPLLLLAIAPFRPSLPSLTLVSLPLCAFWRVGCSARSRQIGARTSLRSNLPASPYLSIP